jgi:hypothetical protein
LDQFGKYSCRKNYRVFNCTWLAPSLGLMIGGY